jgi:uncharacterized membrane protein
MSFSFPLALLLLIGLGAVIALALPLMAHRRRRDLTSLILRCVIFTLLVLALAGTQIARSADTLAVVFVVDASDSISATARDGALSQVRDAIADMGPNDRAGVILFGQDSQIERPVSASRTVSPARTQPNPGNTDLSAAIRLALAMFPADSARRIVILSDGQQTLGDAAAAARLAEASNVEISVLPIRTITQPDVRVTRFDAPSAVPEGQPFDLNLTIQADVATLARVNIFAGQNLIATEDLALRSGTNNRTLTLTAGESGFRDFTVVVEPSEGDGFYQNNQLATFSQVIGPASVLLVRQDASESQYLAAALREAGLTVSETTPGALPPSTSGLAAYQSVVLINVPADRLSPRAMEALQVWVRDLGGGLVVTGGPDSFGPGGYFQTPLETVLPLDMQLKDQERQPRLTIAYLIDRSGSMATTGPDGAPLIELAKAAISRSIDFLQPQDIAGVATFDSDSYWVANLQEVGNREELRRLVGTLRPSGGTDILAGLTLVSRDIVNQPSQLKHILLLSDGMANRRGLLELATQLNEAGVTLTTVAIGDHSELMRDLSEVGGGSYRLAETAASIPAIFAQETVLATRSYLFEVPFTPALSSRSPILQGVTALPQLLGYVGTTEKPAAQVLLRGPEPYGDPILAAWQYGLGRSVAFTSDVTARWGANWVSWGDFTRFWSQSVGWTITEDSGSAVETRVIMEETQARVVVDARDSAGGLLNGLDLRAAVVDPTLGTQSLILRQTAPGRYEATFKPDAEGAYLLRVNGGLQGQTAEINRTSGWVMRYSREYTAQQSESVLPELAQITGGQLYADGLGAAFAHTLQARTGSTLLSPLLILLALLLLPVDVAVRRLYVGREDWSRLRAAIRPQPVLAPSEQMAPLLQARERARQAAENAPENTAANTAGALRERLKRDAPVSPAATVRPAAPVTLKTDEKSVAHDAKPQPQANPEGNLGARLLKRRQDRDAQ